MADIGLLLERPRGMGVGGAKIKSALTLPTAIKQVMIDIADDLDSINTEGALGLSLLLTKSRLNQLGSRDTDWGQGGGALSGSPESVANLLRDAASDLSAIDVAGSAFGPTHTAAKIPLDFMHGGSAMHRNPASDDGYVPAPGVGPDGVYDWIVQPLNAIANDIAAAKAANALAFTPKTIPA